MKCNVVTGKTASCGCARIRELQRRATHGLTHHPLYKTWLGMRDRCANPNNSRYATYGFRGIRVCPRWDEFPAFLADMGPKPSPDHSIDRINVDMGYEPSNCRWATRKAQARNTTRNHRVAAFGETKTLAEWAEDARCRVTGHALKLRIRHGWSPELAIAHPATTNRRRPA